MSEIGTPRLPHARTRLDAWTERWRRSGRMVLLLDFDGTLAPIVERPETARIPQETRDALERLSEAQGTAIAVVSGRSLLDARHRVGLPALAYAGNHGMEIYGAGIHRVHEGAAEARPSLDLAAARLTAELRDVPGAIVENKRLTLSVHYRMVERARVKEVRRRVLAAVQERADLRTAEGEEVLEVRPRVDWHKGRAVEFLLEVLQVGEDALVLYLGDDATDEDAFRALRGWGAGEAEGIVVADPPPPGTAAHCYLRDPDEVGDLIGELARRAPG